MVSDLVINQQDTYLFHEGNLFLAYQHFGAHLVTEHNILGVRFTIWAPNATYIRIVGSFNDWDGSEHVMELLPDSGGIWTLFIPGLGEGTLYKYEIHRDFGQYTLKADPYGFFSELRPRTASVVYPLAEDYPWQDESWRQRRQEHLKGPINIYEVHLGSWRRKPDGALYTYREIAPQLVSYVKEMGYTHIELLPVMEHPLDASWGYQITGFFAVTSRYGTPDDFRYFVDYCHQHEIGVILDWVPGHFCRDAHGLAFLDGTPLYEAREIYSWGTWQFDFAKPEVRSFLISNAVFWFDRYHIDGLRVDAVSSILYPNFKEGIQLKPIQYEGAEPEAITFIKRLNEAIYERFPDALIIAEESSAWPMVTRPTYMGGLGFYYKWNMGWMNDTLRYMALDYPGRQYRHNLLTFSFLYAFSENFLLSLSHDEVVHGKRSLIEKMPGDYWQKFANLRVLLGYMMAHPGKKLLFMGCELAQFIEWRFYEELEWHLLKFEMHQKFQQYIKHLNHFYLKEMALWELDHDYQGFQWINADNAGQCVVPFIRKGKKEEDFLVVICNFTPTFYERYRIGLPRLGVYQEAFNSDLAVYGGSNQRNISLLEAEELCYDGFTASLEIVLPPLAIVCLKLYSPENIREGATSAKTAMWGRRRVE